MYMGGAMDHPQVPSNWCNISYYFFTFSILSLRLTSASVIYKKSSCENSDIIVIIIIILYIIIYLFIIIFIILFEITPLDWTQLKIYQYNFRPCTKATIVLPLQGCMSDNDDPLTSIGKPLALCHWGWGSHRHHHFHHYHHCVWIVFMRISLELEKTHKLSALCLLWSWLSLPW